jgi:hypothetical protein
MEKLRQGLLQRVGMRTNSLTPRLTVSFFLSCTFLRTPKGWTGPKQVDGIQIEGSYRSHQVPMASPKQNPSHLSKLEAWLMSYKPQDFFDEEGKLLPELKALVPPRELRMGEKSLHKPQIQASYFTPLWGISHHEIHVYAKRRPHCRVFYQHHFKPASLNR